MINSDQALFFLEQMFFFFSQMFKIFGVLLKGKERNKIKKKPIHVNREPWLAISSSNQMEKQQLIDIHWQKVGLDPAKFYCFIFSKRAPATLGK